MSKNGVSNIPVLVLCVLLQTREKFFPPDTNCFLASFRVQGWSVLVSGFTVDEWAHHLRSGSPLTFLPRALLHKNFSQAIETMIMPRHLDYVQSVRISETDHYRQVPICITEVRIFTKVQQSNAPP